MNCFLWFEISENIWRWNRIICCKGFRCFSEIKLNYQIYQISPPPSPTWANIPQNCPSGDNFGKFFGGFDIVLKERGEGSNQVWFKCQNFTQRYPFKEDSKCNQINFVAKAARFWDRNHLRAAIKAIKAHLPLFLRFFWGKTLQSLFQVLQCYSSVKYCLG